MKPDPLRWNSLSTRLATAFAVFVLGVTVAVTGYSYYRAKAALEATLRNHGRMLVAAMEGEATDRLVQYDYVGLRKYVEELAYREPVVSYAALVNAEGTIVAHSDHALEGGKWRPPEGATVEAAGGVAERRAAYKGTRVLELTLPVAVAGKRIGTIQVGMNDRGIDKVLHEHAARVSVAGLLILLVAVLGMYSYTRRITRPLTRLVETSREIAAGELRTQVAEEGPDEIRSLARAFNTMAENLRTILRQIQETGSAIGASSAGMIQIIQDQASGTAQQAATVTEVTATVEELSRTSKQIADNAEEVKNIASRTVERAQHGTGIVREGVAAMAEIRERVGDIARKTLFLGDRSQEIGKVMDIIKEIASEIHLLALNAAIESAAAGENGRRFAVVASEVRRLAEKTRESTETIRSIISEIQAATNTSVLATEEGTREVDRWRETIVRSSEAFEEIIRMIEKTSEASTQISMATHQQTSANEQVVQTMQQIAEMVLSTAANMKESSAAAVELRGMVETLRERTAVFRV